MAYCRTGHPVQEFDTSTRCLIVAALIDRINRESGDDQHSSEFEKTVRALTRYAD
jgi:hypothetical protein